MAYKEFENRRALFIADANTNLEIPNVCAAVVRGNVDPLSTSTRLYDPAVNFLESGIEPGDLVYCYGTSLYSEVVDVTATYVDIDPGDPFLIDGEKYFISKKGSNRGCMLYVGNGSEGSPTYVSPAGDPDEVIAFYSVQPGTVLPIQVVKVLKGSSTSAFVALW